VETLESILRKVQSGERYFSPASNSDDEIQEFQRIAKILRHADTEGLISRCNFYVSQETGDDLCYDAHASGGLTYKGEQFLATPPNDKGSSAPTTDLLDLKPNFYGVGININEAWRRFARWFGK